MEKSALYLTIEIINQKKVMATTEVKNFVGTFVVKLRGLNTRMIFYKQLPLNENGHNFDAKLNYTYYKRTVMKLHDAGWKNFFSLLMMFLCLVMDMVCLSILNFVIKI